MLISVVIPTVPGREVILDRVLAAYGTEVQGRSFFAHADLEVIVERGHPTVGCAWQAGAEKATGDYIHLGNDDCEPHPCWWEPAVEACEAGFIPSPMVYDPNGFPQGLPEWGKIAPDWTPVHCAMIPFMSREQWEKIRPLALIHYSSDNFFTYRADRAGYPCRLRTGYSFVHHGASPGRGAGMSEAARMAHDEPLYWMAVNKAEAGQWTEPWPPGGRA